MEYDILISIKEEVSMFNLLLGAFCWGAFKAQPESRAKRRRYHLATNFARK